MTDLTLAAHNAPRCSQHNRRGSPRLWSAVLATGLLGAAAAYGATAPSASVESPEKPTRSKRVAPSITTQPVGQTVTVGQTAKFTVVAAGSAPLALYADSVIRK